MITAKLDQPTFDALAEKLRCQENIVLTGTQGTIQRSGAAVNWRYEAGVLTLQVYKAPMNLKGLVENRLKDALVAVGVVLTPPT